MGSGKSTLLAAVLRDAIRTRGRQVLTLEEPIEFDFTSIPRDQMTAPVAQTGIGQHISSWQSGVRTMTRRKGEVVLVGEARDRETIESMLGTVETGVTAYCTVHAMEWSKSNDEKANRTGRPGELYTSWGTQYGFVCLGQKRAKELLHNPCVSAFMQEKVGVDPIEGVKILMRQAEEQKRPEVHLYARILKGTTQQFAASLVGYVTSEEVSLISSAEKSGNIGEGFTLAHQFLQHNEHLSRVIKKAIREPLLSTFALFLLIVATARLVIPNLAMLYPPSKWTGLAAVLYSITQYIDSFFGYIAVSLIPLSIIALFVSMTFAFYELQPWDFFAKVETVRRNLCTVSPAELSYLDALSVLNFGGRIYGLIIIPAVLLIVVKDWRSSVSDIYVRKLSRTTLLDNNVVTSCCIAPILKWPGSILDESNDSGPWKTARQPIQFVAEHGLGRQLLNLWWMGTLFGHVEKMANG